MRNLRLALVLICSFILLRGNIQDSHVPILQNSEQAQLIVVLRPDHYGVQPIAQLIRSAHPPATGLLHLEPLGIEGKRPGTAAYRAVLAPRTDVNALMAQLQHLPMIESVERNVKRHPFVVSPVTGSQDEFMSNQGYYSTIGVFRMWARGLTGINTNHLVTVAVIDTGVDLTHSDLDANLVAGYDFVELDSTPQDTSADSHGSMVAGLIAAEINNDLTNGLARGVAGIGGGDAEAGTLGVRVMPLRIAVHSTDTVDCATIAQALDYATTHGAQIVNMSLGGSEPCDLELAAIQRAYDAGLLIIAGAGNGNSAQPFYPAAYHPQTNPTLVIAVTGLDPSGSKSGAANYGSWVDIAAPFRVFSLTNAQGYGAASGTSFSAPFVSGLVAVLMSNYGWSRDQAIQQILQNADNIDSQNPSFVGQLGAGRINADRASRPFYESFLPFIAQ
jgi:subtilisin family serine protease